MCALAFHVVQKWPGHTREFGTAEATQTLSALGFGRQEALYSRRSGEESVEVEAAVEESSEQYKEDRPAPLRPQQAPSRGPAPAAADAAAWNEAEERAHQILDKRVDGEETPTNAVRAEPQLESVQGEDLVDVFNRLVAFGMPAQEAAVASKKYAPQLRELGGMGFENWPEAVKLLDKYQGRLLRVANAMAETMADIGDVQFPAHASDAPPLPVAAQPVAPAVRNVQQAPAGPKAVDTAAVKAKYEELLASGMDKKEAATQAVRIIKEDAARQAAAAEQASRAVPMEVDQSGPSLDAGSATSYDEKLTELASMGFTDVERNQALLRKYAGRVERVVDALCSG